MLLLYGRVTTLKNLDNRKQDLKGDAEDQKAVDTHKKVIEEETLLSKDQKYNF